MFTLPPKMSGLTTATPAPTENANLLIEVNKRQKIKLIQNGGPLSAITFLNKTVLSCDTSLKNIELIGYSYLN